MAALDSLLGNETLKESLSAALAAGRLSHSILLCGEAGTGAGFAARCLAADYLYPNGGASAAQVLAGQSPEYLLLAGEGVSGWTVCARCGGRYSTPRSPLEDAPCTSKARTS